MSFRDKNIKIEDWACNELFLGDYDSPTVDKVLDANRCTECESYRDTCEECIGTGYKCELEIYWIDESDKDGCNVYEYINY